MAPKKMQPPKGQKGKGSPSRAASPSKITAAPKKVRTATMVPSSKRRARSPSEDGEIVEEDRPAAKKRVGSRGPVRKTPPPASPTRTNPERPAKTAAKQGIVSKPKEAAASKQARPPVSVNMAQLNTLDRIPMVPVSQRAPPVKKAKVPTRKVRDTAADAIVFRDYREGKKAAIARGRTERSLGTAADTNPTSIIPAAPPEIATKTARGRQPTAAVDHPAAPPPAKKAAAASHRVAKTSPTRPAAKMAQRKRQASTQEPDEEQPVPKKAADKKATPKPAAVEESETDVPTAKKVPAKKAAKKPAAKVAKKPATKAAKKSNTKSAAEVATADSPAKPCIGLTKEERQSMDKWKRALKQLTRDINDVNTGGLQEVVDALYHAQTLWPGKYDLPERKIHPAAREGSVEAGPASKGTRSRTPSSAGRASPVRRTSPRLGSQRDGPAFKNARPSPSRTPSPTGRTSPRVGGKGKGRAVDVDDDDDDDDDESEEE